MNDQRDDSAASAKSILQFNPVSGRPREVVDAYYLEVHTPFARLQMRGMPHILSYYTHRADAEYDLAAGWRQVPRAFRFVVLRFTPHQELNFAPDVRARLDQDHRVLLRDLREFSVQEQVLVDLLRGRTGSVKYLFEYERRDGTSAAQANAALDGLVATLKKETVDIFGLRRVVIDHVRTEAVVDPIDEPGQLPTAQTRPDTTKQAFIEFWFDNSGWAEDWFARDAVNAALSDPWWAVARGYRVTDECQLDRTAAGALNEC